MALYLRGKPAAARFALALETMTGRAPDVSRAAGPRSWRIDAGDVSRDELLALFNLLDRRTPPGQITRAAVTQQMEADRRAWEELQAMVEARRARRGAAALRRLTDREAADFREAMEKERGR